MRITRALYKFTKNQILEEKLATMLEYVSKTNISSKYDLSDDDDLPSLISLNKKDILNENTKIYDHLIKSFDENLDELLNTISELLRINVIRQNNEVELIEK
mgnify:CR=1 FL=1